VYRDRRAADGAIGFFRPRPLCLSPPDVGGEDVCASISAWRSYGLRLFTINASESSECSSPTRRSASKLRSRLRIPRLFPAGTSRWRSYAIPFGVSGECSTDAQLAQDVLPACMCPWQVYNHAADAAGVSIIRANHGATSRAYSMPGLDRSPTARQSSSDGNGGMQLERDTDCVGRSSEPANSCIAILSMPT
jgi:hypothetical protein